MTLLIAEIHNKSNSNLERLLSGKIIRWINNGYVYAGSSENRPVQLSNYSDIQTIQNDIHTLQNADVIMGFYSGNNSSIYSSQYASQSMQSINIGFKPSWIFVCATSQLSIDMRYSSIYLGCSNINSSNVSLQLSNNGFNVCNVDITDTNCYLNYSGVIYSYICFR